MLVVADTSPFIVLLKIDLVFILPALFGQILVPSAVVQELAHGRGADPVRQFIANPPPWLQTRDPDSLIPEAKLDQGERAAISLALEIPADLLLIHEVRGRVVARKLGLNITGTVGVLELAAGKDLLDLATAFATIKQTDFWISHDLLEQRLAAFRAKRASS